MHLLNEVLPAATSCASAAGAASEDAVATSALSVSMFTVCSSWVSGGAGPTDGRETGSELYRSFPYTLGKVEIACSSLFGELPKMIQTCLICRWKSAGPVRFMRQAAMGRKHTWPS